MKQKDTALKSITIRIPAEMHTELKIFSIKNGTTVQEIVEDHIRKVLSKGKTQATKKC